MPRLAGEYSESITMDTLTKKQHQEIKDIFELLDGNGDGKITPAECKFALATFLNDVNETDVRDYIQLVCTDGSGEIGIADFVQMLISMEATNPRSFANLPLLVVCL